MNNEIFKLVGIKEYPLLQFMPVKHTIMPLLYILIRIDNKIRKYKNDFITERVEILSEEEVAAMNITLLAEIEVDLLKDQHEMENEEYQGYKSKRIEFNSTYKSCSLSDSNRAIKEFLTKKTANQNK